MVAKSKYLISIFAICIVALCGMFLLRKVSECDLLGEYRAGLPDGSVEFLELNLDGVCFQEIHLKNGILLTAQGKWRYFPKTEYLLLDGIRLTLAIDGKMNPDIEQIHAENTEALSVSRTIWGTISIILSDDIKYIKIK